jgi:glycosyltransferase involved in cell wall biosynthesis
VSEGTRAEPLVTVVVPTRNRRDLVARTLHSVAHQERVAVEIVVVDDGGDDGTADALGRLAWTNLRVIRHERSKGVSAARNAGLAAARTPWVAFVDDDDLWAPDKLRSQLEAVCAQRPARWACGGAVHLDARLEFLRYAEPPAPGDVSGELARRNAVPGGGSGILVDRALAREVGGFDEQMSILADWDFNLRLSRRSPMAVVDRPLVGYYVHSDSMFHDPRGMLGELRYMERKYAADPTTGPIAIDWVATSERLMRMAFHLGDRRTLLRVAFRAALHRESAVAALRAAARMSRRATSRWLVGRVPPAADRSRTGAAPAWVAAYRDPGRADAGSATAGP